MQFLKIIPITLAYDSNFKIYLLRKYLYHVRYSYKLNGKLSCILLNVNFFKGISMLSSFLEMIQF